MEILSEHQCEGWLEGYLLTGRHGCFTSYEAFIHIIDSMFNQHAKWLKVTGTSHGDLSQHAEARNKEEDPNRDLTEKGRSRY